MTHGVTITKINRKKEREKAKANELIRAMATEWESMTRAIWDWILELDYQQVLLEDGLSKVQANIVAISRRTIQKHPTKKPHKDQLRHAAATPRQ